VRGAFEAAWLAHAIVDGLTPAHHFPYEEALSELRSGQGIETRTTLKEKLLMHGETRTEKVVNNWKMWGPGGLMSTHGFFELGVAAVLVTISPFSRKICIDTTVLHELYNDGVLEFFRRKAKEIAARDMYDEYSRVGWTPKLALEARNHLVPTIIQTVALVWYAAMVDAGLEEKQP
jgi:hypothetical protein